PTYPDREVRPGRWIAEQTWPSPQITDTVLPTSEAEISALSQLDSTQLLGYQGGSRLQCGEAAGMAGDQAADDARSYTCDWELENGLEIVGTPTVPSRLTSVREGGVIAWRRCDVS